MKITIRIPNDMQGFIDSVTERTGMTMTDVILKAITTNANYLVNPTEEELAFLEYTKKLRTAEMLKPRSKYLTHQCTFMQWTKLHFDKLRESGATDEELVLWLEDRKRYAVIYGKEKEMTQFLTTFKMKYLGERHGKKV